MMTGCRFSNINSESQTGVIYGQKNDSVAYAIKIPIQNFNFVTFWILSTYQSTYQWLHQSFIICNLLLISSLEMNFNSSQMIGKIWDWWLLKGTSTLKIEKICLEIMIKTSFIYATTIDQFPSLCHFNTLKKVYFPRFFVS